ncbi:MAG: non-ribosomal peptide synthetase, partial [Bacteroidota bacterium]
NEKANQLAHYLRDTYNIRPDDFVALQLERSEWMIIAILGVLKSGGAYLPLAPDAPATRAKHMLEDCNARALLTQEHLLEHAQTFENMLPVLVVDKVSTPNKENPLHINGSGDLAYINYTSGSTGLPKGVLVEHRGVVRLVRNTNYIPFDSTQVFIQLATYSFDASTFEIWGPLLNGGKLIVVTQQKPTLEDIKDAIRENGVTIIFLTTGLFHLLVDADISDLSSLRYLLAGGEVLSVSHINRAIKSLPNCRVNNVYGPTENTTYSTFCDLSSMGTIVGAAPIGKPISNTEAFILDACYQLAPIGVKGELCVSGAGLARGYLNNPELTAEKFIPHPFKVGERLYKTGDYARWLPDGNIEFLGRIDQQLKIRGFRVEAGEIEQALLEHPSIQSCFVVGHAFEQGKELVAYLVLQATGSLPDTAELRNFLSLSLPDYMIPAYFVEMEALPLTSTGKVDRKALPAPAQGTLSFGTLYVAPRNERERLLSDIWEQVLRRSGIGVHDNFFHAGGDSIKAIQISSRLGAAGWQLAMKELFAHPTIAGQANRMERKKRKYEQGLMTGDVPLTAVQQWFFD